MMEKLINLTLIFLMTITSCNSKKTEHEKIVEKLLTYSFDMPPSPEISFTPVYIKQSDSIIYTSTTYDLKQLYVGNSKLQEISFSEFVLNSFEQKTFFKDTSKYLNSFSLDSNIYNEFIQNNFEFIANKYTDKSDDEYILKSLRMTFGVESTVSYIFFLNDYFTLFDCVDGETSYIPFRKYLNMSK